MINDTSARPQEIALSSGNSSQAEHQNLADAACRDANAFLQAAEYSALQTPLSALAQLADSQLHTNLLPSVQFVDAPQTVKPEESTCVAQTLGGAVGSLLPYVLTGVGVKYFTRAGMVESAMTQESLLGLSNKEAILTGAIHDALLRPSAAQDNKPILVSRAVNGLVGGANMLAMVKVSGWAGEQAAAVLPSSALKYAQIPIMSLAAMPAGALSAQLSELSSQGHWASLDQMNQAAASSALVAGFFAGAQKFGSATGDLAVKSFRVKGDAPAVQQGMLRLNESGEAMFRAREDLGRHGLLGLLGMHDWSGERTLMVRDSSLAGPISAQKAASVDLLGTCDLDPQLSAKAMFKGQAGQNELQHQPLWVRSQNNRLMFSKTEPPAMSWRHLGFPAVEGPGLADAKVGQTRQAIDILERVKSQIPLGVKDQTLAENLLKVNARVIRGGLSEDGQKILAAFRTAELNATTGHLQSINAITEAERAVGSAMENSKASSEVVKGNSPEAITKLKIQHWQALNEAVDFRIGTLGERRAPTQTEMDLVNTINQKARQQILDLETERVSGQPFSQEKAELLATLKEGQEMLFDSTANRQLPDLRDIENSGDTLSFDEAARKRLATQLVAEGIGHYTKLKEIVGAAGLSEMDQKMESELSSALAAVQEREGSAINAIRLNNSNNQSAAILQARQRLKTFLERAWQRQDPELFERDLQTAKSSQNLVNALRKRNEHPEAVVRLTETVRQARHDMADRELSFAEHRRTVQDIRMLQDRANLLSRYTKPTASQQLELSDLKGITGQGLEGLFRGYVPWAPEALDKTPSLLAPPQLRTVGMADGNNDEQAMAIALGKALKTGDLRLKGDKPYQTADYLDRANWSGLQVPDNSAADHAKGDYVLFNKKTGHYFLFDITSSVDYGSTMELTRSMVARGNEVGLADRKANVAPEREPFILATSKNADWSDPNSEQIGISRLSRILSDVISKDKPFNILESYLPSTNPELPRVGLVAQLQNFQQTLSRMGYKDWSRGLSGSIRYLQGS